MRIIFDFDNTLFRSMPFGEAIRQAFRGCGVDEGMFHATLAQTRGEGMDWKLHRQVELLHKEFRIPRHVLDNSLAEVLTRANAFLYHDTVPYLKTTAAAHTMYVLSYGEDAFQRAKVDASGIVPFFRHVLITDNIRKDKEAALLSGGEAAVFVEDNPLALRAAKTYAPHIITVRILRGEGRYKDEPSGEGIDYEIKNLGELSNIVSI